MRGLLSRNASNGEKMVFDMALLSLASFRPELL